jgi:TonB family protein
MKPAIEPDSRAAARWPIPALALGIAVLAAACATHAPPATVPGPTAAPAILPPIAHKLPRAKFDANHDWYPAEAKRRNLTGRVLVAFKISADGRPKDVRIARPEADPILQSAALALVQGSRFDVTDPGYDPQDATPFGLSIRYCLEKCGTLVRFEGMRNTTTS